MSNWKITGFSGINNMKEPSSLDQPEVTKTGNYGPSGLVSCINFDIDNDNGLVKRDDEQYIFTATYSAKLTQKIAGITFYAEGKNLRYTLPFLNTSDNRRSIISYDDPIVLIQEVEEGLWLSTSKKIYYHSGKNPSVVGGFTQISEYDFPAIMGTGEKVHKSKMGLDGKGFVAIFLTTKGVCYGDNNGSLANISEGIFSYKAPQRGISYIKEENGLIQYQVKLINEASEPFNAYSKAVSIEIDSL